MAEHDVEQVWQEFWKPIVLAEVVVPGVVSTDKGLIDLDQIKRELFDYHKLIKGLPAFFDDITGGKVSKPNTDLSVVAELVYETNQNWIDEALREQEEIALDDARTEGWQKGYDEGHEDGRELGREDGLEDARRMIG